jgi:hypothetical protein
MFFDYVSYSGISIKEGGTSVVGDLYILVFNQNGAKLNVTTTDGSNAQ